MSVIVAKRNKSPIEYLDEAKKINDIIMDRMEMFVRRLSRDYKDCRKVAKQVFKYLYELPIKNSFLAWKELRMGNYIKIVDEVSYKRRKQHFKTAIQYYQEVCMAYYMLYHKFYRQQTIKKHTVIVVHTLIDKEIQRIQNVIKHDQIVYNHIGS